MWHIQYRPYSTLGGVGFLLQLFKNESGAQRKCGFADVRPWPQLGDRAVQDYERLLQCAPKQLSSLKEFEDLIKATDDHLLQVALSHLVEFYRKSSLIQAWFHRRRRLPKTHYLILDVGETYRSFSRQSKKARGSASWIKAKIKRLDWQRPWWQELEEMFPRARWRLDFNGSAPADLLLRWLEQAPSRLKERIDFIEDPTSYDHEVWRDLERWVPVALDFALDWTSDEFKVAMRKKTFSRLIFKPSRQWVREIPGKRLPITVTTQLGHFVDWLWSWWIYDYLRNQHYPVHQVTGLSYGEWM